MKEQNQQAKWSKGELACVILMVLFTLALVGDLVNLAFTSSASQQTAGFSGGRGQFDQSSDFTMPAMEEGAGEGAL